MLKNSKVIAEIERLKKYGVTIEEMEQKYTITDEIIKQKVKKLGNIYNGRIPEKETNILGITPRHVQITFDGEYMVLVGN